VFGPQAQAVAQSGALTRVIERVKAVMENERLNEIVRVVMAAFTSKTPVMEIIKIARDSEFRNKVCLLTCSLL
jgi:hypothetical protein